MTTVPTRDQVPQIPYPQGLMGHQAGGRLPAAGVSSGSAPTGKDILRILRKRLWLIVISSLGIIALICGATLLWWLYAPLYSAQAQLIVLTPWTGSELRAGSPVQYSQDIMNRIMRTHATMAQSPQVLDEAVKDPDVARTAWFNKDKASAATRLSKDIKVTPMTGSNYITISMTGREKKGLADIVNAVARQFETFSRNTIRGEREQDIQNLKQQLTDLQRNRDAVRRQITRQTLSGNLQDKRNLLAVEIRTLTTQMIPLSIFQAQARAALSVLQDQIKDGTIKASGDVLQALDADPQIRNLTAQAGAIAVELGRLQAKFGPNHNDVKTARNRMESIKIQLAKRRKLMIEQATQLLVGDRQAQLDSANAQLTAIQARLDQAQTQDVDIQSALSRIEQLTTTENDLSDKIVRISNALMEYQLRARGEQQVKLAIPAIPPREIYMPKWKIMAPLAVVLGLTIGLGLAFLLEFIDTSIKGPSDITRRVDLPLLGMVPHVDDVAEEFEDLRLAFLTHPASLVGEAFRQIRTCIMFSGPASQQRSLLVTSPLPEDGRTTVAMNLAACSAQGGRKILVVDANFRQPAIRDLFPKCPADGLSSALVGQANWRDIIYEVQPNLHVLPSGILPPNPAELLGSDQMRQMIEEMTESYDQVIIDGAPCLLVSDSTILSTLVDGVILTVRAGANTYGIVQRARDMLQRVGAHLVGAVLNGVRISAGGYLRENYEQFYEYHKKKPLIPE